MLIPGCPAEGFSFYGTGATSRTNMVQGVWAQVDSNISCETTNPRGHGTHSLAVVSPQGNIARRVLGADYKAGLGCGFGLYLTALPTDSTAAVPFQARDGSNGAQWTMTISTTGVIQIRTGTHAGTVVANSASPVITAGAFFHVEFFAISHDGGGSPASGAIEVRVNGVTVINASGIDLQGQTLADVEQFVVGMPNTNPVWNAPSTMYIADMGFWNKSGAINIDFLGDVQWLPIRPNADQTATAWVRNTGSSDFDMIDDTTPDGDTTYIESSTATDVSEFGLENLPATSATVVAVVTQPMLRKTDAGSGSVQVSMISAGSPAAVHNGTDRPMTQVYTYYPDVHETDPATGVAWTPAAVNAARLRLTRTL